MRRALLISAAVATLLPGVAAGQSWRTTTMSRQLERTGALRVFIQYGAGELKVGSIDEDLLYRMRLRYDEDAFEPVADFSGDRLRLGVESLGRRTRISGRQSGELELGLARGVPMDLDLEFGAVRGEIDLGGLALTGLDLSTGASESTIDVSEPNSSRIPVATFEVGAADFTALRLGNLNADRVEIDAGVGSLTLSLDGRWERDTEVSIDMGLGALELRVPEGLGLRLIKESFLTSLDSEGLIKRGDSYESLDFDDAARKITIDLDAAFGSVKVVWIR